MQLCPILPDLFAGMLFIQLIAAIAVFVVTGKHKQEAAALEGLDRRDSKLTYFPLIFVAERAETLALAQRSRRVALYFAIQFAAVVAIAITLFGMCGAPA